MQALARRKNFETIAEIFGEERTEKERRKGSCQFHQGTLLHAYWEKR